MKILKSVLLLMGKHKKTVLTMRKHQKTKTTKFRKKEQKSGLQMSLILF